MKKILKILSAVILVWGILVAVEGFRLIGSTDPGKHPRRKAYKSRMRLLIMEVLDFRRRTICPPETCLSAESLKF